MLGRCLKSCQEKLHEKAERHAVKTEDAWKLGERERDDYFEGNFRMDGESYSAWHAEFLDVVNYYTLRTHPEP